MTPTHMANWFFSQSAKAIHSGKHDLFRKWCLNKWIAYAKNWNLDPYHIQKLTESKSWSDVWATIVKLLEEKEENLSDLEHDRDFLKRAAKDYKNKKSH